jgi:hypothetical protein
MIRISVGFGLVLGSYFPFPTGKAQSLPNVFSFIGAALYLAMEVEPVLIALLHGQVKFRGASKLLT